MSINSTTGVIAGTPLASGLYPVTAAVSDGLIKTTQSFVWTVAAAAGPSLSDSAVVAAAPPTSARELIPAAGSEVAPLTTAYDTLWVYDSFTAVDGTPAQGRAPDVTGTGATWHVWGTPGIEVRGTRFGTVGRGPATLEAATVETRAGDVAVGVDWVVPASGTPFGGIVVRATDAANYLLVRYWNGELCVLRQQNGVWTASGAAVLVAATPGRTHRLTVTTAGARVTVAWDGETVLRVTDAFNQTATEHGVVWAPSVDALTTYDNFDVRLPSPR